MSHIAFFRYSALVMLAASTCLASSAGEFREIFRSRGFMNTSSPADTIIFHNISMPILTLRIVNRIKSSTALKVNACHLMEFESDTLHQMVNLTRLYINNNPIRKVRKRVFSGLRRLQVLDLSGNAIETIEIGAFTDLPKLEAFRISRNRLVHYAPKWFGNSPRLCDLDFRGNRIKELQRGAFKYIGDIHQCRFNLLFSDNRLERITRDVFTNMNIGDLFLQFNQLTLVESDAFATSCISWLVLYKNEKLDCSQTDKISINPRCKNYSYFVSEFGHLRWKCYCDHSHHTMCY